MDGARLKQIVAGSGFSQKELAEKMKIIKHEQDWTRLFKNKDVRSGVLEELAEAMGVPVGHLYGEGYVDGQTGSMSPVPVSRYIDMLQAKDKQIEELHQHVSKLLSILGDKSAENG